MIKANYQDIEDVAKEKLLSMLPEDMDEIYAEYQQLHDLTTRTLEDYNNYMASQHLMQVSGGQVEETLPDLLFYSVSGILSVGLGVVCVLFLELKREKKI